MSSTLAELIFLAVFCLAAGVAYGCILVSSRPQRWPAPTPAPPPSPEPPHAVGGADLPDVSSVITRQQRINDEMLRLLDQHTPRETPMADSLHLTIAVDPDKLTELALELGIRDGDNIGNAALLEAVAHCCLDCREQFAKTFRGYMTTYLEPHKVRIPGPDPDQDADGTGPAESE